MNKKNKIVLYNMIGAFGIKGIALILSLITMPVYMRYFENQEVLGVWYTVLSMMTWIFSFDLGVGNGLRNKLSESIAQRDMEATKEYISSSYFSFGKVVVLVAGGGLFVIPFVPWNVVFNVDSHLVDKVVLREVVLYVFLGIIIQFFLRLISSIIYALQKSVWNNVIALVTSILQLCFALVAPRGTLEQNLRMFAIAYVFCSNIPLIIASALVFTGPLKGAYPQKRYLNKERARSVMSLGGIFFVCQIFYMIIANTNEFFVSHYTNAGYVVEYQIYYRIFSLGSILVSIALTPIWSLVSKAIAEKDMVWLDKIYKKMKAVTWIAVIGELCVVPFIEIIVNVWLGELTIQINYLYAFAFALFGGVMIYQSMLSTLACGAGRMKTQIWCYGVGVFLKFLFIPILVNATSEWITVVWINFLILIPYCILQQIDLNQYVKKSLVENKKSCRI